jgi:general secretion pathway protein A
VYSSFYKLTGIPFQLTPDPRFYFGSRTHSKAMAYLTYGLSQGEGFVVITGEIGAGKTTVVGNLLNTIDRDRYHVAKVVTTQLEPDSILRMVAGSLGIPHEGLDKAAVLDRLHKLMQDAHQAGRRVLVIVDEAQNLSNATLEELRMLSNHQTGGQALVQFILIGQPEFRRRLAKDPTLEQVRQRVIAAYHLLPMADWDETREYIHHRLRLVGWDRDPSFTDGAIHAIHDFCGGMPRRLNQLCSRLLLYGYLEELHEIDETTTRQVIAEYVAERQVDEPGDGMREPPQPVPVAATGPSPMAEATSAPPPEAPPPAAPPATERSTLDGAASRLLMHGFLREMRALDPASFNMVAASLGAPAAPAAPAADPLAAQCARLLMYGFLRQARDRDPAELAAVLVQLAGEDDAPAAPAETELTRRLEALETASREHARLLDRAVRSLDRLLGEAD